MENFNKLNTEGRSSIIETLVNTLNDRYEPTDAIDDINELHFRAFNEDYFVVYHSKAVEWLKNAGLDSFEAIDIVKEYEESNFGEFNTSINPESIVNMVAYIIGEELIHDTIKAGDTVDGIISKLEEL